jgi:hypothetical protein
LLLRSASCDLFHHFSSERRRSLLQGVSPRPLRTHATHLIHRQYSLKRMDANKRENKEMKTSATYNEGFKDRCSLGSALRIKRKP